MDNVILNKLFNLNTVLVLICATAYSKTHDNKYFKRFFYFLSLYFKLLINMDNVILNQNIQFKCCFCFDLCDGSQ